MSTDPAAVKSGAVVSIRYTLKDEEGSLIDSSGDEPLAYLHGSGEIIPGLEKALEGKAVGEQLELTVAPEDAYGDRDEGRVLQVARDALDFPVEEGDMLQAEDDDGSTMPFQVVGVDDDVVTLDGNHPLAGMPLAFEIEVVSVRPATAGELAHGHAHAPGQEHEH